MGRETAVSRVASEDRPVAKVLSVAYTVGADAARPPKPRDTDPFAGFQIANTRAERIDPSNDLMTRNDGEFWVRQFAIHDMQIRPADAASFNPDANLARPWNGIWQFLEDERRAGFVEDHAKHCLALRFSWSMRKEVEARWLFQKIARHAAENPFADFSASVGTRDDKVCTFFIGELFDLCRRIFLQRLAPSRGVHILAREPCHDIFNTALGCRRIMSLINLNDGGFLSEPQQWQGITNRAARLPRIFPSNKNVFGLQNFDPARNHQHGAPGPHDEVSRIQRGFVRFVTGDDEIGRPALISNKCNRLRDRRSPLEFSRPALECNTEMLFHQF